MKQPKNAGVWKKRYEKLLEQVQPYLAAVKLAPERVRTFLNAVFARGKEVQDIQQERGRKRKEIYSLDVIISVGYRVKSKRGTQFRIWATNIFKEYMRKGFALDDERLKIWVAVTWILTVCNSRRIRMRRV